MNSALEAAAAGLQRTARAIGDELTAIRETHPREAFPHQALTEALPKPDELLEQTNAYIQDLIQVPSGNVVTTLRGSAKELAGLLKAAQRIRSTVEWSSRFTAIDWWVARRTEELQLGNKRVLIAPGPIDEFYIERSSKFANILLELGTKDRLLTTRTGEMQPSFKAYADKISDYHVLTVPSNDGMCPLWHPLFLGHEIAHLKYAEPTIQKWLAERPTDGLADLPKAAIAETIELTAGTNGRKLRSAWLKRLHSWLVEIACDSAAFTLYGEAFVDALNSIVAAYTDSRSSESHPSLEFRVAVQTLEPTSELQKFRPEHAFAGPEQQAMEALCAFAIQVRDMVRIEVEGLSLQTQDDAERVSSETLAALGDGQLPSSSSWPPGAVASRVSSIETGMVRGLWTRRTQLMKKPVEGFSSLGREVELVSQAIDGLEFITRFVEKMDTEDAKSEVPTNVLWVTRGGVKTDSSHTDGSSSYDLRLGRYFIVFQRNEVPFLNPLGSSEGPPPIQREVEVGWGESFMLHPSELVLAVTFESLRVERDCSAQVLSRSSLGRLGLLSATAVHVHPGFTGCLTLELANLASVPLRLTPGQRIAQVIPSEPFGRLGEYAGFYQEAGRRPQFSLAHIDWDAPVLRALSPAVRAQGRDEVADREGEGSL